MSCSIANAVARGIGHPSTLRANATKLMASGETSRLASTLQRRHWFRSAERTRGGSMATAIKGAVHAIEVFHNANAGDMDADELLRLAASLDQASRHELAPAIVSGARDRSLILSTPTDVVEEVSYGTRGCVDGRSVALGASYWVDRTSSALQEIRRVQSKAACLGCANVFIAIDGVARGAILVAASADWPTTSWTTQPWGFYA
jgi:hypothetical protein